MKIAFILPKLANQGPIIVAKDIIDNIKNKVELIDVYYFDDLIELDFNCNVYKISFLDKFDFNKYDVVHSHMFRPDLYIWYHRKKYDKPFFLTTLHQNIFDNLKASYNFIIAYFFNQIWLYILRKQDIVVSLTDTMKEFYSNRSNLIFKTIYNGRSISSMKDYNIDENDLNKINHLKASYKIIGSHCLLTKRKGLAQIIASLVNLKDYAFIIIGSGQELRVLESYANLLNVQQRCFFVGFRSNAIAYLKYFDIYLMSSYSEGFPLSILEAGFHHLPVVCSDIPIFRELFTEDEVCFFELDNILSLEQSIVKCYDKKDMYGQSIFTTINKNFTAIKMADKYIELYQTK
jgi:glycosyltransferase involved in cell wall biosynthesis